MTTIQEELALLKKKYPGDDYSESIMQVCEAIDEGLLIGDQFANGACGCFYGHFEDLDEDEARGLAEEMRGIFFFNSGSYQMTPIERFVHEYAPYIEGESIGNPHELARLKEMLLASIQGKE